MVPLLLAKIPPLKPPRDLLSPSFWEQQAWAVTGLSLLVLAVGGLAWWWWRRPKASQSPSLDQQIRQTLESWRHRQEDTALQSEVSQLMRRFAVQVFALPQDALTTEELDLALAARPNVCADCRRAVILFLRDGDSRRFSFPPRAQPVNLVPQALELFDRIQSHRSSYQNATVTPAPSRSP